jgi:hypothetical protein
LAHWAPTQATAISPSASFTNPICITDIYKSRLKIHTQTSSPLKWEYLKVLSLALYFTSSTLLTNQPPQTLL